MKERYITIKVRIEDHKKLKIRAAEKGVSMMDLFSAALDWLDAPGDIFNKIPPENRQEDIIHQQSVK